MQYYNYSLLERHCYKDCIYRKKIYLNSWCILCLIRVKTYLGENFTLTVNLRTQTVYVSNKNTSNRQLKRQFQ